MIRPMGSVIKSLSKERRKTVYPLCRNGFKVSKTHSPSVTLALKLARICGVTVEDIFTYQEDGDHER